MPAATIRRLTPCRWGNVVLYRIVVETFLTNEESRDGSATHNKIGVVVVEDEALIRGELTEAFTYYGFDVFAAEDATEAMAILQAEAARIQFVFTDVHLPSPMNGLAL